MIDNSSISVTLKPEDHHNHAHAVWEEYREQERGNEKVGTLSGGLRRRLSMVLSTIGDPKLVILDEVRSGLDPISMLSYGSN